MTECNCQIPDDPDCPLHGNRATRQATCDHNWEPFWDGSLGYRATDWCTRCNAYRPSEVS